MHIFGGSFLTDLLSNKINELREEIQKINTVPSELQNSKPAIVDKLFDKYHLDSLYHLGERDIFEIKVIENEKLNWQTNKIDLKRDNVIYLPGKSLYAIAYYFEFQ